MNEYSTAHIVVMLSHRKNTNKRFRMLILLCGVVISCGITTLVHLGFTLENVVTVAVGSIPMLCVLVMNMDYTFVDLPNMMTIKGLQIVHKPSRTEEVVIRQYQSEQEMYKDFIMASPSSINIIPNISQYKTLYKMVWVV